MLALELALELELDAAPETELASIVTPAPAALVVLPATSPAVVSVAESIGAADAVSASCAGGAFAGALPPAMTVTVCVWRVVGGALMEPMAGRSWKGAA